MVGAYHVLAHIFCTVVKYDESKKKVIQSLARKTTEVSGQERFDVPPKIDSLPLEC